MKRWIAVLVVLFGLLAWHGQAQASCTQQTIFLPNGDLMFCTTCCYYGNCTTTCI